jgi:hypothetical protein
MTFRIFSGKKKMSTTGKKLRKERVSMQEMLLQACSFSSFCKYNEVFDLNKRAQVTKRNNLLRLYTYGIGINSPHLIINKN